MLENEKGSKEVWQTWATTMTLRGGCRVLQLKLMFLFQYHNVTILQFWFSLSWAWKQPRQKGFWRTWTKHDKKENLVLSPNLKHKRQGQKHETCVQNVC
jgi:hypothetical protein